VREIHDPQSKSAETVSRRGRVDQPERPDSAVRVTAIGGLSLLPVDDLTSKYLKTPICVARNLEFPAPLGALLDPYVYMDRP
jgi:hypothetical protein